MAAAVDHVDRSAAARSRVGSSSGGTPRDLPVSKTGQHVSQTPPMDEPFGAMLRRLRRLTGSSQNALARVVRIDASYIHRLESGERDAPTRQVVEALAHALRLTPSEWDGLLFAAGYVPPSLQKLGPHDSTVAAITRLLTDDCLSPASRADFRAVVETVAARWQCPTYIAAACRTQQEGDPAPQPLGNGIPVTGTR